METKSFQSFTERNFSFSFLQFLVYAQNLYFTRDHLGFTCYRRVVFRVQGFLKYQKPTVKSTNYYQLKKLIDFFDELQANSLIKSFAASNSQKTFDLQEFFNKLSLQSSYMVQIKNPLYNY